MAAFGITQDQACSLTVPYWDWTLDFDSNGGDNICPVLTDNKSGIWDATAFGTGTVQKGTYYVTDGIPAQPAWVTVAKTSSSWQFPTSNKYPNFDNHLKRELYCGPDGYNLNVGPTQAMNSITSYTKFLDFATWLETTIHGTIHMFCGFTMSVMISPDDPLFFLHHCNVDRLYHLWIDCQGYENITSSSITSNQYAANPKSKDNPVSGLPDYTFTSTSEMPYYWDKSVSTVYTKKNNKWPSPKDVWSTGFPNAPGYDGMYYRYGTDQLVRGFGKSCPNKNWTLVDVGYVPTTSKKRDEGLHPMIQEFKDIFEAKVSEGKTHKEALHEMAMTECQNAPKNEITPRFMEWLKLNNIPPEKFDSICDKPSERMNLARDREDSTTTLLGSQTAIPLWVIITASVGSALILIAVITLIIFFTLKRKSAEVVDNDDLYRQM